MKFESKRIVYALVFPLLFILTLGIIFGLEWGLGANWHHLGAYPRKMEGLIGILTSPFIHSGLKHLFSNSVPLLVMGWCLFYFYRDLALKVFPLLWLSSGFFTWILGRDSWHIGASGLVYALAFFLFFSGIFRKYIPLMAVSLIIVFLYGSTVWNMFPIAELVDPNVSWEGHLAGAISGLCIAFIFRKEGPQPENEENEDNEESEGSEGENNNENKDENDSCH